MTIILSKLRHYRLPALRGASSGAVPLGGAGSGSLRPRLVTGPVGVVTSLFPSLENGEAEGASRNPAVERREARRPDRKGRKDASQASSRASQARKGCLAAPRAFRRSAPLARQRGTSKTKTATTEPLATAGGALAV